MADYDIFPAHLPPRYRGGEYRDHAEQVIDKLRRADLSEFHADQRQQAAEERRFAFVHLAIASGASGDNVAYVAEKIREYVEQSESEALPPSAEEAPAADIPSETPTAAGVTYSVGLTSNALFEDRQLESGKVQSRYIGEMEEGEEMSDAIARLTKITTHDHATEPVSPGAPPECGSDTGRALGDSPNASAEGSPPTEADADPVETFSGPASTDPEEPAEDPASDAVELNRALSDHDAGLSDDVAEEAPEPRKYRSWLGG